MYRRVLVSTLLHGFVYDFTKFAEYIDTDCKYSGKLNKIAKELGNSVSESREITRSGRET
jgi:hypothetical protein